jgi:hypothetical protein
MTDEELKLEIIKKNCDSIVYFKSLEYQIIACMEEWAGVISKRIDESNADDELYNLQYRT